MKEWTPAAEIADVRMFRPHVVVLGAGASRAAFPNGDKNGRILPLMADFAACIGIDSLLQSWGIDSGTNFEDTYSGLFDSNDTDKISQLNKLIEDYFSDLEIPDNPTLYDHLILSLRSKDLIATFNWDPLLMQAYVRCSREVKSLPKLAFLHGNLAVGYCEKDKLVSHAGINCRHCGVPLATMPLLYPVRHKNYSENTSIASQWELLKWCMSNAFMMTIFGYSGPKTDEEAISAMKSAWGPTSQRQMEQTELITLQRDDQVHDAWDDFIHTHHFEIHGDYYSSWIANHPRRTGEAFMSQYLDAEFIGVNPLPRHAGFAELFEWFSPFSDPEKKND